MATVNDVTICSNALGRLGVSPITSLLDNTDRGRLCHRHYAIQRNAVLQAHPWNWALAVVSLARLAEAPVAGYSYQFQLPVDYLKVERVYPKATEYEIIGKTLQTNSPTISVKYIREITDPQQFSPLFVDALEAKLASIMAPALKANNELAQLAHQQYLDALARAQSKDSQEGSPEMILSDTFINVRYRAGGVTGVDFF